MLSETIVTRTPVRGGWTPDRKYRAVTADGGVYFLRVAAPERAERMRKVFLMQTQAAALELSIPRPLECGFCEEGFYTLESWIDGRDARDAIPARTEAQLYRDGVSAGQLLRRLHTIPAPAELPDWGTGFRAKLDRRVAEYLACPLKYEHDEHLLAGIAENRELLKTRGQCFQHHDYHVGNFMYAGDRLTVIDFDRCSFGDPWEEFKKIPWCVSAAPSLARGMVDGYFDGRAPEEFWRLLRLYLCCGILSNLPWAIPYGEGEVRVMLEQEKQVRGWYKTGVVPDWYSA